MTSIIYPITPSSGGAPPAVFNGSNNGLVPNPGAGLPGRVLNANGTWALPPGAAVTTIIMNPSVTSGVLGGITWSTTWSNPITLSTSITMSVARMNSDIYNNSLGSTAVDIALSTNPSQMVTRNRWGSNLSSISFGIYSSDWNCNFDGDILCNGFWFRVTGGSAFNANVSDLLITKLT